MKGLDTNILVRYLVRDDPAQAKKASSFILKSCTQESPGFINHIVLCELVWVLESAYQFKKDVIVDTLEKILITRQFEVENRDIVFSALNDFKQVKADFADCLIGRKNQALGCEHTTTFDKSLKDLKTFELL